jgi:hypothetical protein
MRNKKKILIVTCSKDTGKGSQLVQSLQGLPEDEFKLIINAENKSSLSIAYNKQLTAENLIAHDIVLFVHDDVYIDDIKLQGKLYTAVNDLQFDIVGLAGASSLKIAKPALWHKMSTPESWSGAVSHPVAGKQLMVTSFGPWPKRCLVLDGLFLAVNLRRVLETGWKFNEKFNFHHYDISSCLDANDLKLKMGTYPIYVTHSSPGLRSLEDPSFVESQEIFLTNYK